MGYEISQTVASLPASRVDEVVRAYVARRLLPRPLRGDQKQWALMTFGLTHTDIYGCLKRAGHVGLVGGGIAHAREYAIEHDLLPEDAPSYTPPTPTHTTEVENFMTSTMPVSAMMLDGALLEQMIRAEIHRVVTSLKGEIEQHVRKETQAAIERATERGVSTLMRSLEQTMDKIIEAAVTRALDEYTR